jgi:hypothetical protein
MTEPSQEIIAGAAKKNIEVVRQTIILEMIEYGTEWMAMVQEMLHQAKTDPALASEYLWQQIEDAWVTKRRCQASEGHSGS